MHFTDESWALKIDIAGKLFNTVNVCWKNIDETGFYIQEQGGAAA